MSPGLRRRLHPHDDDLLLQPAGLARGHRVEQPLLNLSLFRERRFSAALAGNTLTTFVMFGTFFFVNQYLQIVLHLSPLHAALWSLPGLAALTLGTVVIVPRLANRYAHFRLMAGGAIIMAAGLGLLTTVGDHTAPLTVSLIVLIFQAGVAPIVTLGMNLILSAAPAESTSAASGTAQTSNELGGAMGIALLGSLGAAQGSLVSGLTLVAGVGALIMLMVAGLIWRLLRTPAAIAPVEAGPVAEPVCV